MITYIEKGNGLHEAITTAGEWLRESWNGGIFTYTSSNDVVVQNIINTFNPLAYEQQAALTKINAAIQAKLALIILPYPPSEVDTWPGQLTDAVAFSANPAALTPMLSGISATSGLSVAALAATVMAKYIAYAQASSALVGLRIKYSSLISSATDWTTIPALLSAALTAIG